MTTSLELADLEDSSPSSTSLYSTRDTPITRQTHPSPEKSSSPLRCNLWNPSVVGESLALNLDHRLDLEKSQMANYYSDPFTTMSPKSHAPLKERKRLSATAHVFMPSSRATPIATSMQPGFRGSLNATHWIHPEATEDSTLGNRHLADENSSRPTYDRAPVTMSSSSVSSFDAVLQTGSGVYATDQPQSSATRYLMVTNIHAKFSRIYLDALLAAPLVANSRMAISDHVSSLGMILLRYDDLRCAATALAKIHLEFPSWICRFASYEEWSKYARGGSYPTPSRFEGQILVSLASIASQLPLTISGAETEHHMERICGYLAQIGDLKSSSCVLANKWMLIGKHEFYSLRAAAAAQQATPPWFISGTQLFIVDYFDESLDGMTAVASFHSRPKVFGALPKQNQVLQNFFSPETRARISREVEQVLEPRSAHKTSRHWSNGAPQAHEGILTGHNLVVIDRIKNGQDVRTTIMLRNIPNKVDQPMLKEIVDETSHGKYDFMYLRIDFANNCNVGYAFINFEDSFSIIDFVEAVAGKKWKNHHRNRFNSDKIAEVSYATIQGKDCLVQKFRNSSVMLEAPLFRPKIFVAGHGPRSGEEEKFPPPDNHSKMRRSLENAEHVGLFAPRIGQRFRDEQRRCRSRYDRGTRLAEVEESASRWDDSSIVKADTSFVRQQ